MDWQSLEANYQAQKQTGAFNKPTTPKKSNWLLNLLPTAGGIIGGIGGGVIGGIGGAGVGAVPGTAAGGAAGSALGELLRQKLSGEKGVGYKKIATEAAFGGIPLGGVGKGAGLAVKGAAGVAKGTAKTAGKQAVMSGVRELTEGGAKRIPVKFIEDAAMSAAKKPSVARNLMINPTIGDIMEQTGKGATTGRVGRFQSAVTSGNKSVPFVETAKTKIPVRVGTSTKTSIQDIPKTVAPKTVSEVFEEPAKEVAKTDIKQKLTSLAKPTEAQGRLQKIGAKIRETGRGTQATSKLGAGVYGEKLAKETNEYASKNIIPKTKSLTPNGQFISAERHMAKLGKQYKTSKEAVSALPDGLTRKAVGAIDKEIADNINLASISGSNQAMLNRVKSKLVNAKTGNDYIKALSELNVKISDKTLTDAAVAEKQELMNSIRKALKGVRTDALPETSKIANEMHLTSNFMESTVRQAAKMSANQGGTSSKLLNIISSSGEPIGRGIEALGNVTASPIARIMARETVPRAVFGGAAGLGATPEPVQQPQGLQDVYGGAGAGMEPTGMPQGMPQDMPSQSQYPQQNFIQDVIKDMQATGGKNVANLKMIYEMMNPEPTKESIKAQDAEFAGNQSLNILNSLQQQYEDGGGAQGRIPGFMSQIAGKAGFNDQVNVYNNAREGFLANVARSLGEKGVLTDQDIKRITAIIPSATDNPSEAQQRWDMIRQIIGGGMERAQSAYAQPSSSQTDLMSLMQQ